MIIMDLPFFLKKKNFRQGSLFSSEYVVHATGHALHHKKTIQQCSVRELEGAEIIEILFQNSNPRYDCGQVYPI